MTNATDINDETLTAFLDGELSEDDKARVLQQLEAQPDLAARLARLDVSTDLLRHGADEILKHAPTAPKQTRAQPNTSLRWMAGAAAAAVLGVMVGTQLRPPNDQDWVAAVANYQSLYVTDTLAASEPVPSRKATLASLSQAIDLDITALADIDAIQYRRAQMLGFEGQPLVQVAYLDGGIPIAICITKRDAKDSQMRAGKHFGLASVSWQKEGLGFLVIGGDDAQLIQQIARQVQDVL